MLTSMRIVNVRVCSPGMDIDYLVSREGILQHDRCTLIKIPLCLASLANGGPMVGRRYSLRYAEGMAQYACPLQFCYVGVVDQQLLFIKTCVDPDIGHIWPMLEPNKKREFP